MCFLTEELKYKIAKEDITCYKTLRDLHSVIKGYKYKLNTLNKPVRIKATKTRKWLTDSDTSITIYEINKGYHSYREFYYAKRQKLMFEDIYRCTIPQGTRYCMNEDEIVSENIIIKRKVKE